MMNLKKLRRRLSLTFKGNRPIDTSLTDLAEQMTIEDTNGIKENGTGRFLYVLWFKVPVNNVSVMLEQIGFIRY